MAKAVTFYAMLVFLFRRTSAPGHSCRRTVADWIALLLFAGLCVGYVLLCRRTFFPAGIGFVSGLLVAVPGVWPAVCGERLTERAWVAGALHGVTFCVYFWSSAWFVLRRIG